MDLKAEILEDHLRGRYQERAVLHEARERETLRVWDDKLKKHAVLKFSVEDAKVLFGGSSRKLLDVHGSAVVPYSLVEVVKSPARKTSIIVTVRPFRSKTLSNVGVENLSSKHKWQVMGDVLQGLRTLHNNEIVHGGVRPGNVLFGQGRHAALGDYGMPLSLSDIDDDDQIYFAPEVSERAPAEPASDIYSFGRLAEHLIEYSDRKLWSHSPIGRAQFSWLVTCCLRDSASERPSADSLWRLLFDRDNFVRDTQSLLVKASTSFGRQLTDRTALAGSDIKPELRSALTDVERSPQLTLGISDARSAASYYSLIAASLTIAPSPSDNESTRLLATRDAPRVASMNKNYPPTIDDEWQTQLEREYSEVLANPLGETEDRRSAQPDVAFRLYAHAFKIATEVRNDLLARCEMLHTSEVAELLAVPEADVLTFSQSGRMLVITDHKRFLYPAFQFGGQGSVYPAILEVNKELRASGHEWSTLSWWYTPNDVLRGEEPWVYVGDESQVVGAARRLMR